MTFSGIRNNKADKPQRSCTACRVRGDKYKFIRFVKNSSTGEAVIDFTQKLPGRGAYLCPDFSCLAKAKKGKLAAALKAKINADFWGQLEAVINERSNAIER